MIENQEYKGVKNSSNYDPKSYILHINSKNQFYLEKIFDVNKLDKFNDEVNKLDGYQISDLILKYSILYEKYIKKLSSFLIHLRASLIKREI